ncbi:MAG: exodeoxyribonuclease I [Chromatiales bacterium]|nr:exodeoxyribonuclease I [Gammaproteobacteria bacterium]MBW6476146.1 exodeoxyribonuclease I [Chromatiales bacterium]
MTQNTLYWHDYETSGIDTQRDRPVQFAGLRTDEDLNVIGEPLNIFCRPAPDTLPHPMSALITGITPQQALEQGMPEDQFIARILQELAQPGTCGVGYNSLRFDDEVTRNTLYRNLYDPYTREWRDGNSRWDIIDMVRACRDLRPEGIVWPQRSDAERSSFKLEELTAANGIGHEQAHDALSDVYATIAMAKLIKDRQPKLFEFCYKLRRKQEVSKLLDLKGMTPILHTSGMYGSDYGNTRMVVPVAMHPVNKNSVIVFDLGQDPKILLELSAKKLRERLYTPAAELPAGVERPALKQILINKCPVVAPSSTLDGPAAKRLQIDLMRCNQHRQALLAARKQINDKIAEVFAPQPFESKHDPDLQIYSGFFNDADKRKMQQIHAMPASEIGQQSWVFDDARLQEMLFRFRARSYPETLNAEEQAQWLEHCRHRLNEGEHGHRNFDAFFAEIARIRAEEDLDERKAFILAELEDFGNDLRAWLG